MPANALASIMITEASAHNAGSPHRLQFMRCGVARGSLTLSDFAMLIEEHE